MCHTGYTNIIRQQRNLNTFLTSTNMAKNEFLMVITTGHVGHGQ